MFPRFWVQQIVQKRGEFPYVEVVTGDEAQPVMSGYLTPGEPFTTPVDLRSILVTAVEHMRQQGGVQFRTGDQWNEVRAEVLPGGRVVIDLDNLLWLLKVDALGPSQPRVGNGSRP